jgi:predicted RNase H-like nuclease
MKRDFRTFIGVDLGGGKGKNTAVARLELDGDKGVRVVDYGTGTKESPWFDDRLLAYLREHADGAVVAIDAPLTLPSCIRCVEPSCPTVDACEVPIVSWFRERENGARKPGLKPKYTPYTQRASEVILHEDHQILPRETLGQGMGPLTARGQYLTRALAATHRLNENLIEVYPKATLTRLFEAKRTRRYKRSTGSQDTRLGMLNDLADLTFAPGQWRQHALENDHKFDAVICAYTAYLWSRGECEQPSNATVLDDGWIWFPRAAAAKSA